LPEVFFEILGISYDLAQRWDYNCEMLFEKNHPSWLKAARIALLFFGVMCGATAVIMIKAGDEHPFLVASFRLLIAALVLSPFFVRDLQNFQGQYGLKQIGWTVAPAVALAVHFMSWVIGARATFVANASLLANLTPVAMPFFVWMFFKEKITRQEVFGTALTLLGVVLLTYANLQVSPQNFRGDLICFGSMLAFACYLALGRKNGGRLSLWLYMVPVYAIAGLLCLGTALFVVDPIKPYTLKNVLLIIGLGVIPTVFGHTILNYSLKFFRGQIVSVCNLTQPIFAGVFAFFIFHEKPAPNFYPAAVVIIVGIIIVLFSTHKPTPAPIPQEVLTEEFLTAEDTEGN
jgi:drug/metabolite transporter (DMT)-like permease